MSLSVDAAAIIEKLDFSQNQLVEFEKPVAYNVASAVVSNQSYEDNVKRNCSKLPPILYP